MAADTTSLPVEYLFTISAPTRLAGILAGGPQGTRVVVEASSGSFEGPKLKGTIQGPGGDWVTLRANGTLRLDVRLMLQTDDGAAILMTYNGIGQPNGGPIRTTPLFETGDERYSWLNDLQAVATGSVADGTVTYEVYRLL